MSKLDKDQTTFLKEMPEVIDASTEKAISLASREVYSGKIVSSKDEENK